MMEDKIQRAIDLIHTCYAQAKSPVLAWSGGKDSMALLDLVFNKCGYRMPLVFFREQWQPHKYAFQNRVIEEMGLEVYTWHPRLSQFQQNGDEFEVQNQYWLGNTDMTCPTGITPMEDGKPWVCGMDIYNRPKQDGLAVDWDFMFVGHKLCDSDPIYGGDAGTRLDVRVNPHQCGAVFPMKDWSHDEVFAYCEENDVPIQLDRYEKVDGKWGEMEDRSNNCDYVHACTACIDRRDDAEKFVPCPKLGGAIIENVSSRVMWTQHRKATYMED